MEAYRAALGGWARSDVRVKESLRPLRVCQWEAGCPCHRGSVITALEVNRWPMGMSTGPGGLRLLSLGVPF